VRAIYIIKFRDHIVDLSMYTKHVYLYVCVGLRICLHLHLITVFDTMCLIVFELVVHPVVTYFRNQAMGITRAVLDQDTMFAVNTVTF